VEKKQNPGSREILTPRIDRDKAIKVLVHVARRCRVPSKHLQQYFNKPKATLLGGALPSPSPFLHSLTQLAPKISTKQLEGPKEPAFSQLFSPCHDTRDNDFHQINYLLRSTILSHMPVCMHTHHYENTHATLSLDLKISKITTEASLSTSTSPTT